MTDNRNRRETFKVYSKQEESTSLSAAELKIVCDTHSDADAQPHTADFP